MQITNRSTKPREHSANYRGFTLLEMLVVLVIIGLVASLVGPQLLGRVDSSRVTAADTQIRMLKGALDTLRLDVGRYPTTEEGLSILMTAPADDRTRRKWQGPYLSEGVPLDPWGSPYQYKPNTSTSITLYSFGADGKEGGEGMDADVGFLASTTP
ncbi:MAG: type II secretion system major pseudopilin GspG [Rhodospirillaceae bacterium]